MLAARSGAPRQGHHGRGHGACDSSIEQPRILSHVLPPEEPHEGVQPVPHYH